MTDDDLTSPSPLPLTQTDAVPPSPDASAEHDGSAVHPEPAPPKRRRRRGPKLLQFAADGEPAGEPEPVRLDVPEPGPKRRAKKITPDQAVSLLQVPFHGMAQFTGAAMWEVDPQECEWFKDELADVLQELSRQSGGKLGHYFPYIVAGSGVAFLSLSRAYGYYQLAKIAKAMQQRPMNEYTGSAAASHPPTGEPGDNGFDQAQADALLRAMMGQ